MCFFYLILAVVWLFICLRHWRDLLRIQFWIGLLFFLTYILYKIFFLGAVIVVGMIEKAVFYTEYSNMNLSGESIEGLLEVNIIYSLIILLKDKKVV